MQKQQIPDQKMNVGRGWERVLDELHMEISAIYPHYEVIQVKEKFGGLRVYINHYGLDHDEVERIEQSIQLAESRCAKLCENCGALALEGARLPKGKGGGWYRTLCDMCRDGATGVGSY